MKSELRGWPVEFETFPLSFSEYFDFAGLRRKSHLESEKAKVRAAESLKCENLTIVTHDEDSVVRDRGHDIRVVPAWKWCLAK